MPKTQIPKLTLSIRQTVVTRAKQYARKRDTSVSKLVEDFLDVVSKPAAKAGADLAGADVAGVNMHDAPILRSLQGTLRAADQETYRQHLIEKYR